MDTSNFQIVVLTPPLESLEKKEARYYFSNMCQMKLQGYQAVHGKKSLPLDHYDYLASHLLICLKGKEPTIVSGFRSLSYNNCLSHDIEFDLLLEFKKFGNKQSLEELQNLLAQCNKNNTDIFHNSRWTTLPEYKKGRKFQLDCLALTYAIMYYHHHHAIEKQEWLCSGINSLKTEKMLYRAGGIPFGSYPSYEREWCFSKNEKLTFVHGHKNRDESRIKKYVDKHKKTWDERIII
ncbi:hypothetical protein ABW636_10630 [Aquimarina sp. 2201CG1-2-11]|uniref:hypothetical protein n=1 Tax=Aquimarina discodermiae TaxID=3231043 RepID=UPI003461B4C5